MPRPALGAAVAVGLLTGACLVPLADAGAPRPPPLRQAHLKQARPPPMEKRRAGLPTESPPVVPTTTTTTAVTLPPPAPPPSTTTTTSAPPSGPSGTWARVAVCEEGGRNDPTFGYLGILPSTWTAYGMTGTAGAYGWDAQVAVANRITGGVVPDAYGCASW